MANLLSNLSSGTKIAGVSAVALVAILNGKPTASNATLPIVTTGTNPPPPATNGDTPQSGSPSNTPIYASGNAANAPTALRKSNQNIAHVCNLPASVNTALFKAGATGRQIVLAIRNGIKALLKFLGITPSSNGLTSQLKKLAQDIKDATKYVKDLTDQINGLIVYVNAVKQLISYILSLPAELIIFFKDCLQKAYAQLQAGYLSVVDESTTSTDTSSSDSIISAAKDVMSQTTQLISASVALAAAPANLAINALSPSLTPVANTQAQQQATTAVFSAAGFSAPVIGKP
jgi:hypothetical protein